MLPFDPAEGASEAVLEPARPVSLSQIYPVDLLSSKQSVACIPHKALLIVRGTIGMPISSSYSVAIACAIN